MNAIQTLAQTITSNEVNIPTSNLTNSSIRSGLQIVFGFAGSLAMLIIVIAGLRYVASAGDPKGAAKAKSAVIFAVVGLVVSAIAFSIVTFVLKKI